MGLVSGQVTYGTGEIRPVSPGSTTGSNRTETQAREDRPDRLIPPKSVTVVVLEVGTLRELFRNIQAFRSVYETEGIDTIIGPDGVSWCLWDLEYLYTQGLPLLPPRQRQAVELCLVQNIKEADAAEMMGVSRTNPVSMYASSGLLKLIGLIQDGHLPRFRFNEEEV